MRKQSKNFLNLLILLFIGTVLISPFGRVFADPISDPTHFDDTFWYWPSSSSGYTEMDTGITPLVDGSPDGYYFSTGFYFTGDPSGYGGYMGLQTEGAIPTGKIAIFSIWGATASSGGDYNGSGTEVGSTYYTSRISYPWVVNNTYDLRIALTSQSSGSETWTASVTNESSGVWSLIGNIVTPSSMGNLQDDSYTFHERYSGPTASCSDMQESEVKFINLSAQNGTITPTSHTNDAPTGSACAGDFATENLSNGVETIIGGQFPPVVSSPAPSTPTIPTAPVKSSPTPSTSSQSTTPSSTTSPSTTTVTQPTPVVAPTTTKATTPAKTINKITKPPKKKELSLETVALYTTGIGVSSIVVALIIGFAVLHQIRRKHSKKAFAKNPYDHDLLYEHAVVVGDFSVQGPQTMDTFHGDTQNSTQPTQPKKNNLEN